MLLKYFYDEALAQASYLVACQEAGVAIVIDPAREITPYVEFAAQKGLNITHIAETHIHADFVSGSRQLASAFGATIVLSAEGGDDWQYTFPEGDNIQLVRDGDKFYIGNVLLEVMHTPGHTPEHVCYILTDTAGADRPLGIFTGDCLFVGDMGRPDLLETVANVADSSELGARQQYANVRHFRSLPDYLQIFPGHGAGSACGKDLGAMPSTTLGYEKLFNPAFQFRDEDSFVSWMLADQPEPPTYFARMKVVNKEGATLLQDLPQAQHLKDVPGSDIVPPDALFIDTRSVMEYQFRHIAGTINVPITSNGFNTYVGWYADYSKPTFFIAYQSDVQAVLKALFAIGLDDIPAYFTPEVIEASKDTQNLVPISPVDAQARKMPLVDVRGLHEYEEERIEGAVHIPMGEILHHLDELPHHEPFIVYCTTGIRSQVVASLLQTMGYNNVHNLEGGIEAWKDAGLEAIS
jgi:hydroxyacylglutathione hydrolase